MRRPLQIGFIATISVMAVGGLAYLTLSLASLLYLSLQGHLTAAFSPLPWLRVWFASESAGLLRGDLLRALGLSAIGVCVAILLTVQLVFNTRRQNIHGDARFARPSEMRRKGLFSRSGIIVGKIHNTLLRFAGEEFVMIAAPTRTGKGVAVVVPNLLDFEGSVLVVDIKFEHFNLTSAFRRFMGQEVYLFNPFAADEATHRWNPLDTIRRDPAHRINDILAIAYVLYPQGKDKDAFWSEQARNLFLGVVLLLMETRPDAVTMANVFAEVSGRGEAPKTYLARKSTELKDGPFTRICVEALARFCLTSENTLTSILATFNGPLTVFSDPKVAFATSASDFDLRELRRKPMSVYLGIGPAELLQGGLILNLFVSRFIQQNVDRQPSDDHTLCVPCLVILDEFAALGKIEILAKASAYIASYGLRLLTVIQSSAQLDSLYGEHDARTLRANHALHIHFAPRDTQDAKRLSERLGNYQIEEISRSRMERQSGVSNSQWTSSQKRPLRLPQELQLMSSDEAILILDSIPPIRAQKAYYYTEPLFIKRLKAVSPSLRRIPDVNLSQKDFEAAARSDLRLWFRQIEPQPSETPPKPFVSAPACVAAQNEDAEAVEKEEPPLAAKRRSPPRRRRVLETDPEQLEIKLR